ncbi:MAG: aminotransferase class IV [Bdellovibrionaceae bacterium]|nr:aminotransferase class IV [Pseudobdellovibrionaceae bacterium]
MDFKRIDDRAFVEALRAKAIGPRADYKAFYSSFLGGITTEPHHMVVPIDDHMVHRGDAVFEAIKFHDGGIFALDRHLERLEKSAQTVGFSGLWSRPQMVAMISETVRVSELRHGLIRLFVARGPGGFTTNPYETIGTQVYCAVTKLAPPPAEKYVSGVRVGQSAIAVKEGFFARTKTCNYLPNVLMKKEAVDRGFDFVVSVDEDGFIAESSTENFAMIDADGVLVVPAFERILRGVTAIRAMEVAKMAGLKVENRRFLPTELQRAKGALMLGTTIDVLPVKSFEAHEFGVIPDECRTLMRTFDEDLRSGPLNLPLL